MNASLRLLHTRARARGEVIETEYTNPVNIPSSLPHRPYLVLQCGKFEVKCDHSCAVYAESECAKSGRSSDQLRVRSIETESRSHRPSRFPGLAIRDTYLRALRSTQRSRG